MTASWLTPFDGSGIDWHTSLPSPYTYQESDFSKLLAAVHEYESRCLALKAALDALGWETERRFDRLPTPEDGYTGWKS